MKRAQKKTARGGNPGRRGPGPFGPDHEDNMIIAQPFEAVKMPVYDLMPPETATIWNAKAARLNREAELRTLFWAETNEAWTQEWREELTAEEAELVAAWDEQAALGMGRLCREILARR